MMVNFKCRNKPELSLRVPVQKVYDVIREIEEEQMEEQIKTQSEADQQNGFLHVSQESVRNGWTQSDHGRNLSVQIMMPSCSGSGSGVQITTQSCSGSGSWLQQMD